MLYRICTENTKKQYRVREEVSKIFDGYTLLKGIGYWRGKREQSLIIEIAADCDPSIIKELAERIRVVNNQDSVLVQTIPLVIDPRFLDT